MLLNISYNRPKIKAQIEQCVGKPFTLVERVKMGGIGSGKLSIASSSIHIHNLLVLDKNANVCNIEIRPKGIILRFRSILETYALVIPYRKLHIYKGKSMLYSIYMDEYFVKIKADQKQVHQYIKKILEHRLSINDNKRDYYS